MKHWLTDWLTQQAFIFNMSILLIFLSCFYPWQYILNVQTASRKRVHIFIIVGPVFPNLFWKICSLFGQIFITCLKCSKCSFWPSPYSKKMCWVWVCSKHCFGYKLQYCQLWNSFSCFPIFGFFAKTVGTLSYSKSKTHWQYARYIINVF